jgi:alpha-L-rhamnosidase
MLKKQTLFSLFVISILCFSCKQVSTSRVSMSFEKLLINTKQNPTAIENKQPDFSWIINAEGYNKSQAAYQVLVASSENKLNEDDADIWNSDKVKSDKSAFVKYQGEDLEALQTYYWKVKIWDEKG